MYELTYILNPNLSETELSGQVDKVRGFINEMGGEVKNEKIWEKRRLSYPIKKLGFGYYVTAQFNLLPENAEELEKKMKFEPVILRHLLIVKEEVEPTRRRIIRTGKPKDRPITAPKTAAEMPKEKVKIEEIDKKLEEILEQ